MYKFQMKTVAWGERENERGVWLTEHDLDMSVTIIVQMNPSWWVI
jgi:hypothetical protein